MNNTPKIRSVVFDLDGTLMSSSATIYKCTLRTFQEFNIAAEVSEEEFNKKIGYHFKDIFADFNISVPDLEGFIDRYKALYFDFIDESKVYPNVLEALEFLKSKGILTSLLTTKAQDQAERILEHFGLKDYFSIITGRQNGMAIKPAPDALLKICRETGVAPAETLMVGDSELDIRCGKNAGSLTCGVTFGYRLKEELEKENPDYLISDMKEIIGIIGGELNK
ncbi:MAG: HAD family hydrolase [Acidobacteriota bacterium]